MRDDRLYLSKIVECIERIQLYTKARHEVFMKTEMIQDAAIRNLEIIGEATKQLSQNLKQNYPDIQWRQIAGLRDVLIHDYLRVSLDRV
jgi:uncharacterized protein with HEPN domain